LPLLELRGVAKRFGAATAVHPLDLGVERGEFLAILGPSGCGKTTLLRMVGGFEEPSEGRVLIEGRDVTRLGPERRPTNMVFQGYGLFPHLDVARNVAYGLRLRRLPADEIRARVAEMLRLVRLEDFASRPVTKLSGGQQQRVALARALVMRPAVLLLDEPLAALDLKLRKAMQDELRRLHREIGGTFVFVTHDQEEALGLASRIAVMEAGRVVQEGPPEAIYRAPRTRFVSTFLGDANVLPAARRAGVVELPCGVRLDHPGRDGPVSVVLRPEAVRVAAAAAAAGEGPRVEATLVDAVFLGAQTRLLLRLPCGQEITALRAEPAGEPPPPPGSAVPLAFRAEDARCLDEA
jgi:spermidine/putrescine transport system ATP-binding protein